MSRPLLFARSADETNIAAVDEWSSVHALAGFSAGLLGVSGWTWIGVSLGYEVFEYIYERPGNSFLNKLFGTKRAESDLNVVADLALSNLAFVLGAWLVRRPIVVTDQRR